MSLRLITDTTPARDPQDPLRVRVDGIKYAFRVELHTGRGITAFCSSWYFGNEEQIEAHLEQVEQAFAQADSVEVVR